MRARGVTPASVSFVHSDMSVNHMERDLQNRFEFLPLRLGQLINPGIQGNCTNVPSVFIDRRLSTQGFGCLPADLRVIYQFL